MSIQHSCSTSKATRQFLKKYGKARLRHLLSGFVKQRSPQALADDFEISLERLQQWKELLQHAIEMYEISPNLNSILRAERSPSPQLTAYLSQRKTRASASSS